MRLVLWTLPSCPTPWLRWALLALIPWKAWFGCSTLGGSHPPIPRGRPGCCTAQTGFHVYSSHKARFHVLRPWCSQTLPSPLNYPSLWAAAPPSASLCPSPGCFSFPASTAPRALILSILLMSCQLDALSPPPVCSVYFMQTGAFPYITRVRPPHSRCSHHYQRSPAPRPRSGPVDPITALVTSEVRIANAVSCPSSNHAWLTGVFCLFGWLVGFLLFCFFGCTAHMGSNPCPLQWKPRFLTTGLPGKALQVFFNVCVFMWFLKFLYFING